MVRTRRPFLLAFCILMAGSAQATVSATVDRPIVDRNESFTLELVVSADLDASPDLSALDADFEIGQTSKLSNTRIVNGQITRSISWTITLMSRRSGTVTIPPIPVGNEQSNPVTIQVREPANVPPGEADVFISADVDYNEAYVQAQVMYTIKIFQAVATRQPVLRPPEFTGAEAIVEQAGEQRNYEAVLGDRAYSVRELSFAVFPQEEGEISIAPARFEARVLRDGRITGRKVFESEGQVIAVRPIPAPPADYPNAAWLPAREVTLQDQWSREPDELRAGEPISRNVTVTALGQLETQIPVIDPPLVAGVNVYPDRPALSRNIEAGGIRGSRTDQYAMIGVDAGEVRLPALELAWFDIDAGEWRVATAPERVVNILPSLDAELAPPVVDDPEPAGEEAVDPTVRSETVESPFWRRIAEILGAVWALTLFAWWWSSRPRREEREPEPVPIHKQQSRLLKDARKAAVAGDGAALRKALLDWARLQWPVGTPRSIGDLSTRVSAPLSEELERLSNSSYGKVECGWDGERMAKAIRAFKVLREGDRSAGGDLLPPLMPPS